jgi:hypothetical protein
VGKRPKTTARRLLTTATDRPSWCVRLHAVIAIRSSPGTIAIAQPHIGGLTGIHPRISATLAVGARQARIWKKLEIMHEN